jgi:glycosyltransferase involved in cell wall biosynthesis
MRQFRIVHTESSLGWGGQEWRVFLELQWMRQHGHQVWLGASPKSQIFARARDEAIPCIPLSFQRWRWPDEILRLAAFFRRKKIEVVNTHSSRDAWLGALAARMVRVPLIIRSRHIEVDYENPFLARVAFEALPDHVLTTSQRIAEKLMQDQGISPHRLTCLPTGVDLKKFYPQPGGLVQKELGLPATTRLVGMVSVLRSWKGHDDFLAAIALLKPTFDVHFVIVGGGPGREYLERRIRETGLEKRVTLLGYREDIPVVLASLAILVLPSTAHEGVPQIILQAQAMARAVIGTTIGGIPEVITDGETGLLVPPQTPAALAAAIQKFLDDPAAAQLTGERARQGVIARHSLDVMGETLEALYSRYLPAD